MRSTLSILVAPVVVIACRGQAPPAKPVEAPVAPVAPASTSAPLPPPDPPRANRFPGGPGVTLVFDQLSALVQDKTLFGPKTPHEARVAAVRKALGVQGEPRQTKDGEATGFVAVGPRNISGPWSCNELLLKPAGLALWSLGPTDHKHCGLPYDEEHGKDFYKGPGPRWTVAKLQQLRTEVGAATGAAAQAIVGPKLGKPDSEQNGTSAWTGIGARDASAPVSCWVLEVGAKVDVVSAPLERCGLSWGPPPAARFDPGPPVPPMDKPAALAECTKKCSAKEMCMLHQRWINASNIREDADGPRAHYLDGYPAPIELTPMCTPIPATCAKPDAACFFGKAPNTTHGPCPQSSHPFNGHAFTETPTPHITCFTRFDRVLP